MLDELKNIAATLLKFNTEKAFEEIVTDNEEYIVDLQREQLAAGIDNTGSKRQDKYALSTINYKQRYGLGLGQVTDRVTFFDKGNLYGSLVLGIEGKQFEVTSPLETYTKMIERYGADKFGLDETSKEKFAEEITLPQMKEKLLTECNLAT